MIDPLLFCSYIRLEIADEDSGTSEEGKFSDALLWLTFPPMGVVYLSNPQMVFFVHFHSINVFLRFYHINNSVIWNLLTQEIYHWKLSWLQTKNPGSAVGYFASQKLNRHYHFRVLTLCEQKNSRTFPGLFHDIPGLFSSADLPTFECWNEGDILRAKQAHAGGVQGPAAGSRAPGSSWV